MSDGASINGGAAAGDGRRGAAGVKSDHDGREAAASLARAGGTRWLQGAEKPKDARATAARLLSLVRGEGRRLIVVLLFVSVSATVALLAPYLIGRAVDAMTGGTGGVTFGLLGTTVITLIAAYCVDACSAVTQGWLVAGISQRLIAVIRRVLFAKLQKLPIAFFDTHEHGDLMSRLANDIDNISTSFSQVSAQLMAGVLAIAGSFVMMLVLSPVLTLAALITVPLFFLLTRTISGRTRVLFKAQQVALGALNGHTEETISGIQVVKAFEREQDVTVRFSELNAEVRRRGTKALIWSGFLMPLMNVISNLGFVSVAAVGGYEAVRGVITVGVIASFLAYSRQFARPLNDIANIFNTFQTAMAGAERVFEIVDEAEEPADDASAVVMHRPHGAVTFEDVGFAYVPGRPVLTGVSFHAPAGSSTALVGPTGAGKTTIVNLLARFYDVSAGRILIDGRDIRGYTRDSLRRAFGIVLQDTYLFAASVRDNIAYGRPDASDAEIEAAAAAVNADHFIRRFPDGYRTMLAESGSNLSQGQRQLIAIARAILADPAILILDEATSNVDTRTELHIQEAMLTLMEGRTSFIIAHRLSTIRDADRILVIDRGTLVAEGTHDDLVQRDGVYRSMYESQMKGVAV